MVRDAPKDYVAATAVAIGWDYLLEQFQNLQVI